MEFYLFTRDFQTVDYCWPKESPVFAPYYRRKENQTTGVILIQKDKHWDMACFFGANRKDHYGRWLRTCLVVSGSVTEEPPLGLLYYFFKEEYGKIITASAGGCADTKLRNYFDSKVEHYFDECWDGEKRGFGKSPQEMQEHLFGEFSQQVWLKELSEDFRKKMDSVDQKSDRYWVAPFDDENLLRFFVFCNDLFTGKRNGIAVANSGEYESSIKWKKLQENFSVYENFACLVPESSDIKTYTALTSDKIHAGVPHATRKKTGGYPSAYDGTMKSDRSSVSAGRDKKKAIWVLLGMILLILLTISLKNCGSSEKKSLTSSTIPITTKTQNNNNKK